MYLWIIYRDISFAHTLKLQAKSLCEKIELIEAPDPFLAKLTKGKRDKSLLPDLVFIELEPGVQQWLDLYRTLVGESNPISEKIFFYSSVSYESFCDYFKAHQLDPPIFFQKSQLLQQLTSLLQKWDEAKKAKGESAHLSPLLQKNLKSVRELFGKIEDLYYQNIFNKEALISFRQRIEGLNRIITVLSWPKVIEQATFILKLMDGGGGTVRLKKEIRELNLLINKELKKWE